jgi:hypothetical protein
MSYSFLGAPLTSGSVVGRVLNLTHSEFAPSRMQYSAASQQSRPCLACWPSGEPLH